MNKLSAISKLALISTGIILIIVFLGTYMAINLTSTAIPTTSSTTLSSSSNPTSISNLTVSALMPEWQFQVSLLRNNSELVVNSNLTYLGLQNATYVFGVDPLFAIWVNLENGTNVCPTIVGNMAQEKNVTHGESFNSVQPIIGCALKANEKYVLNVLPRFGRTSLADGQNLLVTLPFIPSELQ